MKIDTFGVEMWMNEWETKCEFNLAETCVESLTIDQLFQITGKNKKDLTYASLIILGAVSKSKSSIISDLFRSYIKF